MGKVTCSSHFISFIPYYTNPSSHIAVNCTSSKSQQCALVPKKADAILGYVRKSVVKQVKEGDPATLCSPGETIFGGFCPVLDTSVLKRDGVPGADLAE
ncbi:hypothetical protein DUI87_10299 [Hirundo rustica rustica]|uniref:Uncharacterized protein n=1 Tax=Hirundo rustica rustica TaxID=333673 RepID=A0A3M0KNG1_HIRRU|nr:hypothetical protein DUI87_10299 [Hirundo rustica rustica]